MKKSTITSFLAALVLLLGNYTVHGQCSASFTWNSLSGGVVSFSSTSTPATSLTAYYWNFGTGNTYTAMGNAGISPSFTYAANGTYTVTLFILSTVPSCSAQITQTISVTNASSVCALNANWSFSYGTNGTMNFLNTSSGTTGSTTYTWNFGNGSTGNTTNASHTYTANGTYTVTLYASNNSTPACVDSLSAPITVSSVTVCNLQAAFGYTLGNNGKVNFKSTSTGTASGWYYYWGYGNGTTGGGVLSQQTYTNGTYVVTLTVANSSVAPTCSSSVTQTITVTSNTCFLSAGYTFTQLTSGQVAFSSTSTGTNSGTGYLWNFGNGTTSGATNPTATYAHGGFYMFKLTIFDTSSPTCSATANGSLNITSIPCSADASFTLTPSGTPGHWIATPSHPWNVSSVSWNWGDATTSNTLYASHTYSVSQNYNICLTVTANCGATASTCATYSIYKSSGLAMYYVNVEPPALVSIDQSTTVGIAEHVSGQQPEILIAPNPATAQFALIASGLVAGKTKVVVYDALGRMIFSMDQQTEGQFTNVLDFSDRAPGMYLVTVQNGSKSTTRRLIITHK